MPSPQKPLQRLRVSLSVRGGGLVFTNLQPLALAVRNALGPLPGTSTVLDSAGKRVFAPRVFQPWRRNRNHRTLNAVFPRAKLTPDMRNWQREAIEGRSR